MNSPGGVLPLPARACVSKSGCLVSPAAAMCFDALAVGDSLPTGHVVTTSIIEGGVAAKTVAMFFFSLFTSLQLIRQLHAR